MVVPGMVIHYIRHGAETVFKRFPALPPRFKGALIGFWLLRLPITLFMLTSVSCFLINTMLPVWGPAVTALASVPLVCHPIGSPS